MLNNSLWSQRSAVRHLVKGKVSPSNLPLQQITIILLLLPVQQPRGKPRGLAEQQDNERTERRTRRQRRNKGERRTCNDWKSACEFGCICECSHVSIHQLKPWSPTLHLGNKEAFYLLSIKEPAAGTQGCCEVRAARERKDLSYVAVFLCQEHQLGGICLRSLVIVDSMFEAIVFWSVTHARQTGVLGFNQLT